jgi:hypothetical protein
VVTDGRILVGTVERGLDGLYWARDARGCLVARRPTFRAAMAAVPAAEGAD